MKKFLLFWAFVLLGTIMCSVAVAEEETTEEPTADITVICRFEEEPIPGVELTAKLIAYATVDEKNNTIVYELVDEMAEYSKKSPSGIERFFDGMTASESNQYTKEILEKITFDEKHIYVQVTDENGVIEFSKIPCGVYVIEQTDVHGEAAKFTRFASFMCDVPYFKDNGTVSYRKTISPKSEVVSAPDVEISTTAVDKADGDKVVDGTKTEQTIVDTVKYKNLLKGKEYTIKGKVAYKTIVEPTEETEEPTEEIRFVKDAEGNDLIVEKTFIAEDTEGTVDVEFTFDVSPYAGQKLVCFEDLYYEDVLMATHADIDDVEQTVEISLLLHVKIAKVDKDNIKYVIRGAEITIFDEDNNIVLDIDGEECVGVTNEKGEVDFTIVWDRNKKYYAKETKAPEGFAICDDLFEVAPTTDRESDGVCLIPLQIRDRRITIIPKTGDETPIGKYIALLLVGVICVIGAIFVFVLKRRKSKEEE